MVERQEQFGNQLTPRPEGSSATYLRAQRAATEVELGSLADRISLTGATKTPMRDVGAQNEQSARLTSFLLRNLLARRALSLGGCKSMKVW